MEFGQANSRRFQTTTPSELPRITDASCLWSSRRLPIKSSDEQPRAPLGIHFSLGATQGGLKLSEVFGQFSGPKHALAGFFGVFEGKDFGVQSLTREINGSVGGVLSAPGRIIRAVTDQGVSSVGRLDADLMFPTGLQPEPQFGDDAFAVGERILRDDFVMCDGFLGLATGGFGGS